MLSDTDSKQQQLWRRFQDKDSRDNWASAHLGTTLSSQIFSLREDRGWTQQDLAEKVGMAQSRISVLEDPDYEKFSVSTLKRIASAFDVVFVGRFVSFSEMLDWATNLTPERLTPVEFDKDTAPWVRASVDDVAEERETATENRRSARNRRQTAAEPSEPKGILSELASAEDEPYGTAYGGSSRGSPLGHSLLTLHR